MEFGIFDWIDRDPLVLADTYEQRLQVIAAADALGYWCYHLAEHHGTPLGMAPAPGLFLAAASQRTRRIRLGPLVYLLPLYNPVRLAEEICMLDHLSRGRLELGIGRGASPYELAMLNVDVAETKAMFDEALDIILMGLTTGRVDYAGEHYTFRDVLIPTRPYQQPYPPLWYPTSNPASMPWVGEQRFNLLFAHTTRRLRGRDGRRCAGDRARGLAGVARQLQLSLAAARQPAPRGLGRLRRRGGERHGGRGLARHGRGAAAGAGRGDGRQLLRGVLLVGQPDAGAAAHVAAAVRGARHTRLPHCLTSAYWGAPRLP